MPTAILLIESCSETFYLVRRALSSDYKIFWATSIEEGFASLPQTAVDLIIVGVDLPSAELKKFIRRLRSKSKMNPAPVLFMAATDQRSELGLDSIIGSDDVLVRPYESAEFTARIEARLKRSAAIG